MSVRPGKAPDGRPSILVYYHYLHPDDVVSARHFGDLCQGLARRGWRVEAMPSNRSCHRRGSRYSRRDSWGGVAIRRIWRPDFRQHAGTGRILNALWMVAAWGLVLLGRRRGIPDVLLFGTDPVLSVLVAVAAKVRSRGIQCVQWSFDLYPEAPVADGLMKPKATATRILRGLAGAGLRRCDCVVDLGACMRQRLSAYQAVRRFETIPPWALAEPEDAAVPDPVVRRSLFGECRLALLYSGNLGRPHDFESILHLARTMRGDGVTFCFSVRGSRLAELEAALTREDRNVRLADFASEENLASHLAAADVHIASLRADWSGIVVPSKFFGCLAMGRPVVFAGDPGSGIGSWISRFDVGWVLDANNAAQVASSLRALAEDPQALRAIQTRCHAVYRQHFSREHAIDAWDRLLRSLLDPARGTP